MALRDRLARLPPLARPAPPQGGVGAPAVVEAPPTSAVAPAPAPQPPAVSEGRAAKLEELRTKMAAILGRTSPPAARPLVAPPPTAPSPERVRPRDEGFRELPFAARSTPAGVLHERVVRLSLAARFGRAAYGAALSADVALLALLALDPSLAGLSAKGALFLDTETTGLGTSSGVVPFLVGAARVSECGEHVLLEQWLLRDPGDEAPLLEAVRERMEAASFYVTYNGKSFDVPLLHTRFVMNRLRPPAPRPHLDLLHVARRLHRGSLSSFSLSSVEAHALGHERVGDIAGADILSAYTHYLRTGDESAVAPVIEHNDLDVRALVALVGVYGEALSALLGAERPSEGVPSATDLSHMALTLHRAGARASAERVADAAVERGAGPIGHKIRGELALRRGDFARALVDFEVAAHALDDAAVRLRLAKLYEHRVRRFEEALALVSRGTGEGAQALDARRARLVRKLSRASAGRKSA